MSIAESGGPTTQAGISYQNGVAALYLGKMLDPRLIGTAEEIIEVRVEAPEDVDDIVVTYRSGIVLYIQAKESLSKFNKGVWGKVWTDFEKQFNHPLFKRGKDKLQLCLGSFNIDFEGAKDLFERASTAKNYEELQKRISQKSSSLLDNITTFLSHELKSNKDDLLTFLSNVQVIVEPRQYVEEIKMLPTMPESNLEPSTLFSLLRDHVGILARVRFSHTAENLNKWLIDQGINISKAIPFDELRSAVYSSSSILRHQKNTIGKTGKHIKRTDSKEIANWLIESTEKESIGVLLDQAGTGKTVLIREILHELESNNINVLAIKADQQLSRIENLDELQSKLGLPIRIERLASTLATGSKFIVLIDQIDALSLSMAHDQQALNLVLDLISRLRSISGVRILISCRKFDFDSDPRLKNFEGCKQFTVKEFSEEEIFKCLEDVGFDYNLLLPSTKKLLRIPLHLSLFLMALESGERSELLQKLGFTSLQELYHLLWEHVIMKHHPDAPSTWDRKQVLILMADYMDQKQKITVPKFIFTTKDTVALERAIQWLSSEGIIQSEREEFGFFHQTFFDYCYAKNFVENDHSLAETLLASPQGLFQRPQLIQVLSYLRGLKDQEHYLKQLTTLLNAENLRYHLKNHLYQWFASIPSPSEHEWRIVKRMTEDQEMLFKLLQFSSGNSGWFYYWRDTALPDLLVGDTEEQERAFGYLRSVIVFRQKEIIEFLKPYFTKNQQLEQSITNFILSIHVWECQEAIQMLEEILSKGSIEIQSAFYGWEELARYDSETFCRILRSVLDQALERYKEKSKITENIIEESNYHLNRPSIHDEMNKCFSDLQEAISTVVDHSALYFLETLLPWLINAIKTGSNETIYLANHFIYDSFFHNWYDRSLIQFEDVMEIAWIKALVKLSHEEPKKFLEKIEFLSGYPYTSTQFLVAHVLRNVPDKYATFSLQFLLEDPRRLTIGDSDNFESRHLIKAIFPHLQKVDQLQLEEYILNHTPLNKEWKLKGYYFHDLDQLVLLQAIGQENLSPDGNKRFLELERKFPEHIATDNPRRTMSGGHDSPIGIDRAHKLTDRQWLQAMTKYQGLPEDWLIGGASELARVLQECIKEEPQRFWDLFNSCNSQLDQRYVCALLNGLAESVAPAPLLFKAILGYKHTKDRNVLITIARVVEQRAHEGISEQIKSLLYTYLYDENIEVPAYNNEPISGYLNTVRGKSMQTLMQTLNKNEESQLCQIWDLLKYAVHSNNIALRAGAILELIYMIRYDRQLALDLFEKSITGYPQLYQMPYTADFLYWAMGSPFKQLIPHFQELLNCENKEVQQRGAELVALSLISENLFENQDVQGEMEDFFRKSFIGPPPQRRGLARIFSHNILNNSNKLLLDGLKKLFNDEDMDVQRQSAWFLYNIKHKEKSFTESARTIIGELVKSQAAISSGYILSTLLWEQGKDYPGWTLAVINDLLKNDYIRSSSGWNRIDSTKLIHAIMNIYTDPFSDVKIKTQAMDTFDNLLRLYSIQALNILTDWDRR
ncbi:NACHT domain-containing protein [Paenibacillus polymyxa]|uniref:NACHT domain-containing protein n=1 Tax=Paenibacillus polymyxa TaxID=1406 RepID=UPI003F87AF03